MTQSKESKQKGIVKARAELLDRLNDISALQADIIKGIYIEGLSRAQMAGILLIGDDRVQAEETAAFKNLFHLVVGDDAREFFSVISSQESQDQDSEPDDA